MGGASRAVHEVSMTTAPRNLLIGDYGICPPPKKKKKILHPPNAHMNTVSTVKEGKSVGEGGRCKAWGRENEAEMDGNKVALCLGQRRKGQRKGKKSQNKGVLSQMQL